MSTDENPDAAPDFLGDKLLYPNAETPGGFPPEMVEKIERSGGLLDEEDMRAMSKRLIQVRNMLTSASSSTASARRTSVTGRATLKRRVDARRRCRNGPVPCSHHPPGCHRRGSGRGTRTVGPLVDVAQKLCG